MICVVNAVNGMVTTRGDDEARSRVHIRLTLTRGVKVTSSMNPAFNIFGSTCKFN